MHGRREVLRPARLSLWFSALALAVGLLHESASAKLGSPVLAARKRDANAAPAWPLQPLTPDAWFSAGVASDTRYRLDARSLNGFLDRFADPSRDLTPFRAFWNGRYGGSRWRAPELDWSASEAEEPEQSPGAFAALELSAPAPAAAPRGIELLPTWMLEVAPRPGPELFNVSPAKVCPPWQRGRMVTLLRWGAERDTFRLIECDGSVAPEALDRLSVIARPPGTPHPGLPLPPEPTASTGGEWLPRVKMVHPRLVWLVNAIAGAFPGRPLYVVSGYRPEDHGGFHRRGRALDLFVFGVPNEELFRFCRTLHDVACGFYPNNKFVHVDVRAFGSGHPLWIDVAKPNERSRYVDSWPGVAPSGALLWPGEG